MAPMLPPPDSYYIPRNLTSDEFARWALELSSNTQQLRSILGPPGRGKSTFLAHLLRVLPGERRLLVFEKLDFTDCPAGGLAWQAILDDWLDQAVALARQELGLLAGWPDFPPTAGLVDRFFLFCERLYAACAAARIPILGVDALDALEPKPRDELQQCLVKFLLPAANPERSHAKIVLIRRDDYALESDFLLGCQDLHELEALPDPCEQIRRRLLRAGLPETAWPLSDWDKALDQTIARLSEAVRLALLAELGGPRHLCTSNPRINLFLLERRLDYPARPLTQAEYCDCLRRYLLHAGASDDDVAFVNGLAADKAFLEQGVCRSTLGAGVPQARWDSLTKLDIARIGIGTYTFEPGVVFLLKQCHTQEN